MSSGDRESIVTVEERSSSAAVSGFPQNRYTISSMSELLEGDNIKEFASKITKDPGFSQMVEQLWNDEIPLWDQQFISSMRQFMEDPQLMTIAVRLSNALTQDPVVSSILDDISNLDPKEKFERQMLRLRDDPSLKPFIDVIEKEGPDKMMYCSYEDILKKVVQGTGIGPLGEATVSSEHSEGVEQAEVGDEFDDHRAASTGNAKGN